MKKKTTNFQCLLVMYFVLNLVEFFFIWRIYFLFFYVLYLNCVFLHLIRGNYFCLCLGFVSALTLIYRSMSV